MFQIVFGAWPALFNLVWPALFNLVYVCSPLWEVSVSISLCRCSYCICNSICMLLLLLLLSQLLFAVDLVLLLQFFEQYCLVYVIYTCVHAVYVPCMHDIMMHVVHTRVHAVYVPCMTSWCTCMHHIRRVGTQRRNTRGKSSNTDDFYTSCARMRKLLKPILHSNLCRASTLSESVYLIRADTFD